MDPEPLVKTLEEVGNLDPSTRLQVDKANRSIVAYAPLADHVTIRSMIEKLDGSARGGVIVPVTETFGLPVKFVGLGESADDLEPFDPAAFVQAMLEGAFG